MATRRHVANVKCHIMKYICVTRTSVYESQESHDLCPQTSLIGGLFILFFRLLYSVIFYLGLLGFKSPHCITFHKGQGGENEV